MPNTGRKRNRPADNVRRCLAPITRGWRCHENFGAHADADAVDFVRACVRACRLMMFLSRPTPVPKFNPSVPLGAGPVGSNAFVVASAMVVDVTLVGSELDGNVMQASHRIKLAVGNAVL